MRRARVALAVVVATLAAVAAPAAGPAGAAPGFTVTPTDALLSGQPVRVSGTDLPPSTSYRVAQCGGAQADTCATELNFDDHSVYPRNIDDVTSGAAGSFSTTLIVQRHVVRQYHGEQSSFDCAAGGCTIGVFGAGGSTFVPITVQPTGTYVWPEAHLMAVPTIGVVEHQQVSFQVTGLNPRGSYTSHSRLPGLATVEICRAIDDPGHGDCESPGEPLLIVMPDGTVIDSVRLPRRLDLPGGAVDCAVVGCTIAVTQEGNPVSNRVPLTFGPEWAPFGRVESFLQTLEYIRGRALPAGQQAALVQSLGDRSTSGAQALADAAEAALVEPRTPATRFVVDTALLYRAFFGRGVETGGLHYWTQRMAAGLPPLDASRAFGGTKEFALTYGSSSNAAVVKKAYLNTLGRQPDASGLAYWTGRLDAGLARWKMIHGFGRSPELAARERIRTVITVLTFRLVGRAPTAGELSGNPSSGSAGSVRNVAVDLLAAGDLP